MKTLLEAIQEQPENIQSELKDSAIFNGFKLYDEYPDNLKLVDTEFSTEEELEELEDNEYLEDDLNYPYYLVYSYN